MEHSNVKTPTRSTARRGSADNNECRNVIYDIGTKILVLQQNDHNSTSYLFVNATSKNTKKENPKRNTLHWEQNSFLAIK